MSPDDPRHGSVAGYNRIPCREECCKRAMATYKARWEWDKLNGRDRITSTIGTRRRIESLAWLGWSRVAIADRAGMKATNMTRLLTGETMTVALAAKFAEVYESLCMTLPTGNAQAIANVRNQARARGAVSPLAWDDIDDPDDIPAGAYVEPTRAELLTDLHARGSNITEVCRALKTSRDTLQKWCSNNGLSHVYRDLAGRESNGRNQYTSEVA